MSVQTETGTEFTAAWEEFTRATRRARGRSVGPLGESGLSLAQYQLLAPLGSGGELTVSELAVGAGVAPPTATRMLDACVRDGLVTRRTADHDRRAVAIELTEKGRVAVEAAGRRVETWRARVRDSLTPAEQQQAAALLRRLAAVVEEQI
jgi:DNA-binding MarR family transcriptional regulator